MILYLRIQEENPCKGSGVCVVPRTDPVKVTSYVFIEDCLVLAQFIVQGKERYRDIGPCNNNSRPPFPSYFGIETV